jgi:hypothetical protein
MIRFFYGILKLLRKQVRIMKKTVILVFSFWVAVGNFAYASANLECASRMQTSSCCPSTDACDCEMKAAFEDLTIPVAVTPTHELAVSHTAVISEIILPLTTSWLPVSAFESPPKNQPLYQLFSSYRI